MTATHAVVFECKHRAILLDEEYGDGSAWCQQCGEFRCYDDQPARGVGVTGDTPTNRYGHGHGCVCPLCSQTTTALSGETTDDAIHFAAPWEPRSSLCGQWDKNLAPIDRLGDVGGTRCWTCLQVRDWILNAIPQAALAGETSP